MIDKLFGSKNAGHILLYLYHYGEAHPRGIAKGLGISLSSVQNQLERFEDTGVVVSKLIGNVRIYFFNGKFPITKHLLEILKLIHSSMTSEDKEELFKQRLRPRRPGKPVIGRGLDD
jgi:DNA-binding Lrp family transcriptional regulator